MLRSESTSPTETQSWGCKRQNEIPKNIRNIKKRQSWKLISHQSKIKKRKRYPSIQCQNVMKISRNNQKKINRTTHKERYCKVSKTKCLLSYQHCRHWGIVWNREKYYFRGIIEWVSAGNGQFIWVDSTSNTTIIKCTCVLALYGH